MLLAASSTAAAHSFNEHQHIEFSYTVDCQVPAGISRHRIVINQP
ncbi:hypothetical protein JCM19233_225 [Vibrio astriarenae]|nr:hypothetical protein JCM19233_225 [Vibrio sp. C7]